jgi:hypothetical protein
MAPPRRTNLPLLDQHFPPQILERLREAGFEVAVIGGNPERIRVMKYHCAAFFERRADGTLELAQAPGYMFRGEVGRLWDAGYQKFWLLGPPTPRPASLQAGFAGSEPADKLQDERRRPAIAEELRALHNFSEELKAALEVPSFYNESIGTTSEITAYDRVTGRGSPARQRFS